jgi:hypothetical protein
MTSKTQCSKTVLAGHNGCRVIYCHDCRVAEIEVGSVSLRLKDEAFLQLRRLIDDAADRLSLEQSAFPSEVRHVH